MTRIKRRWGAGAVYYLALSALVLGGDLLFALAFQIEAVRRFWDLHDLGLGILLGGLLIPAWCLVLLCHTLGAVVYLLVTVRREPRKAVAPLLIVLLTAGIYFAYFRALVPLLGSRGGALGAYFKYFFSGEW